MATDPATQAVLDALVGSRVGEYATSGSGQFRRELAPLIVAAVRPIIIRECAQAIEADSGGYVVPVSLTRDAYWTRHDQAHYAALVRGLAGLGEDGE